MSGLHLASKSCNVILEFYFKQNSVEKKINIQQALFFVKNKQASKTKKVLTLVI